MKRASKNFAAIIIASLVMAIVALPSSIKQNLPIGSWAKAQKITLGLDLQGGTQLDYRIDLSGVKAKNSDDDPSNDVRETDIIEGVRSTIERRVDSLGVSEPQIYISSVGDEKHIIVELAGIKDVNEARKVVGKTIQLEFKEQRKEGETDDSAKLMRKRADEVLNDVLKPDADFTEIGNTVRTGDKKIDFRDNKTYWDTELPDRYKDVLSRLKDGQVYKKVIEGSDGYVLGGGGSIAEQLGAYVTQLVTKEEKDRTLEIKEDFIDVAREISGKSNITLNNKKRSDFDVRAGDAIWGSPVGSVTDVIEIDGKYRVYNVLRRTEDESEIQASHILIAYKGAERAPSTVTRSKKDAQKESERIAKEVSKNPDTFADLAKEFSDGPSGPKGGDLGFFGRGVMTKSFEDAAYSMAVGDVSDPVETEFGYHVIKVTDKKEKPSVADVEVMTSGSREVIDEALTRLDLHEITRKETQYTTNEIYFNTTPDSWKPTGLDGSHFKYATVAYDRIGTPQVSIEFDNEGALMFEKITERLVNKPLAIFVGGQLISAPNVQQKITGGSAVITGSYSLQEALQLANDLNTGAIDAPILLSGQNTISATLGQNALSISLIGGIIGLIIVALFMVLYYRLLGIFAVVALTIYAIIILFILNVFPIVMTLAGIAGIILSIGMAVDANILIFERTREEMNEGKAFSASISAGFDRAWASIRDSNVSTLITCAILWSFGNSIIRGFALMLAIGVVISMFTAITATRAFLRVMVGTKITKNRFLLGVKELE